MPSPLAPTRSCMTRSLPRSLRARRPALESLEGRSLLSSAGSLDASFGSGGLATTSFGSYGDRAAGAALQPDGRLIVAGTSGAGSTPTVGGNFALARYNTNGSLDASFGTKGKVTTSFTNWTNAGASSVALYPSSDAKNAGKIVAAGIVQNERCCNYSSAFAVARFNPNGTLDTTFGNKGKVTTSVSPMGDASGASAVVIQPGDGKVLVAGGGCISTNSTGPYSCTGALTLVRYNADGSLDTSFGSGGKVQTIALGDTGARDVALQPDGKIVVVGDTWDDASRAHESVLARYNPNGTPDNARNDPLTGGFGPDHSGLVLFQPRSSAHAMAIQSDGSIVVAGANEASQPDPTAPWYVARFTADGVLDPAFGSGGTATTQVLAGAGNSAESLALQADGSIVAAGSTSREGTGVAGDFAVARYLSTGQLDPSFGTGGVVLTPIGPYAAAGHVLIQPGDGKVVAVGYTGAWSVADFAVARYLGSATVGAASVHAVPAPRSTGAHGRGAGRAIPATRALPTGPVGLDRVGGRARAHGRSRPIQSHHQMTAPYGGAIA